MKSETEQDEGVKMEIAARGTLQAARQELLTPALRQQPAMKQCRTDAVNSRLLGIEINELCNTQIICMGNVDSYWIRLRITSSV